MSKTLEQQFPVGTLVRQAGYDTKFAVVGYWRGYVTLESVTHVGVTHQAPASELTIAREFAITYSYPTSDRYYRGQRGVRVEARDEKHALWLIQKGQTKYGYGPCPDARIVRAKEVTR